MATNMGISRKEGKRPGRGGVEAGEWTWMNSPCGRLSGRRKKGEVMGKSGPSGSAESPCAGGNVTPRIKNTFDWNKRGTSAVSKKIRACTKSCDPQMLASKHE